LIWKDFSGGVYSGDFPYNQNYHREDKQCGGCCQRDFLDLRKEWDGKG